VYEVKKLVVGQVEGKERKVKSVLMPRARFVEIVEETLDAGGSFYAPIRDDMLAVAGRMVRFPMNSWMTPRGCGCVVGEYLVAQPELDRIALAADAEADDTNGEGVGLRTYTVERLLDQNPNRQALVSFGTRINGAIGVEIGGMPTVGRDGVKSSVELID
jgi:hypothetical protein